MAEIEVTAMTFGPYAVGRAADGRTVMVANAAPGDRLEVTVTARRRDYDLARVGRVVSPGIDRREPPCPFLPRCGGCDWQQLRYAAQLRAKAELVASAFGRAFGTEIDPEGLVEPSPSEFGYRSRIRLKADSQGRLGFFELGTNRLVAIDRCMVAADALVLPLEIAGELKGALNEVEIVSNGQCEVVIAHLRRPPSSSQVNRVQSLMDENPALQGVVLRSGLSRQVLGNPETRIEIEQGLDLRADADMFSQVNHEQNRKLVAKVMEMAILSQGVELLDLFCGAGNLSLPAARRGAKVTGIDSDPLATGAAERNAARLRLTGVKFMAMKAAQGIQFLARARYRPDVVILDPPRTGPADLIESVARMAPRQVIYVSCDIATSSRDMRALISRRYRIGGVYAFDFFPNTHHVETIIHALLT